MGEWRVGAVVDKGGGFAYCVAESRYSNGQSLIIALNARDEFNLGLGMPSAHLTRGAGWKVQVVVDGTLKRDRQAVAPDPDMLVIANGHDRELYDALSRGSALAIVGPNDTVAFQLSGTAKALRDLRACADRARAGLPFTPLGKVDSDHPQLPPLLKELLKQAGFKKIDLLPASAVPPGYPTAETVWRIGPVISGINSVTAPPGDTITTLSDAYVTRLKGRCSGDFHVTWQAPESLPTASLRLAEATCTRPGSGAVRVALTFDLGRDGLLQSFFHEAPASDGVAAIRSRDAIADVLRRLSTP